MADETQEVVLTETANPSISDDVREAMEFDPFPDGEVEIADAVAASDTSANDTIAGTEQTSDSQAAEPEAEKPAAIEPETPEVAADNAVDDVDKAAQDALDALSKVAPVTPPTPAAQPASVEPAAPVAADTKEPEIPSYAFQISPQLVNALGSEDVTERTNGVQALIQGVGQAVHKQVMEQVSVVVANAQQATVANVTAQNDSVQQANSIETDYYGTFPNHSKIKPLVFQVWQEIVAETNYDGEWGPEIRNAIGARVNQKLSQMGVVNTPAATPTAPKPPYSSKPRASAPAVGTDPNSSDEIMDVLF